MMLWSKKITAKIGSKIKPPKSSQALRYDALSCFLARAHASPPMEYSGSRYEGPTSSGRPEGQGTYIFPNGTRYVGGFKNGVFEGKGTMYTPGGGSYAAT